MAIQTLQVFKPFPAPISYGPDAQSALGKQMINFYEHCKLYRATPASVSGRIRAKYTMDLSQKKLCYANSDHSKTFQMMKVSVHAWSGNHRQDWTFTILENGNFCTSCFTILNERRIPLTKLAYPLFNGNEFESESFPDPTSVIPEDRTWDQWKLELGSEIGEIRKVIFPLFQRAIKHLCDDVFQGRAWSVLDVGGCDGDLALSLLDDCEHIELYTLVEKSVPLANLAQSRSECDCQFHTPNRKKLRVVQADSTETELLDATGKIPVDVIILSGIIAENVLTKEQSLKVIDNCKRALKDRGFVIVAAYSCHHFGASDYEKMGFTVHNRSYSFPVNPEECKYASIQFYVIQKRDS